MSCAMCNAANHFLAQLLLTCLNKLTHITKHGVFSFQMMYLSVIYTYTLFFF